MAKDKKRLAVMKIYTDNINDPAKQIKEYKKLLKKAQESADINFVGFLFHMLAVAYNMLGDREKLFLNAVKSLTLFKNTDDHDMIADAYITLGTAYFNQENYQLALANYDKAYEIIRKHRIKGKSRLVILNNLGAVYDMMEDYKSGIRFLSECLELSKKESPDKTPELLVYSVNLAESYMRLDEPEKAAAILKDAEVWAEQVTLKPYLFDFRIKYALANYRVRNIKLGNKNADMAFKLAEDAPDAYSDVEVFRDLIRILLEIGDRERLDKAAEIIMECSRNVSHTADKLMVCSALADYYRGIGDLEHAVEYYEQVEWLYRTRTRELKQVQLSIHKSLKDADSSINKLNRMITESEERANKDFMTKLLNHSAMLKIGEEFIENAARKKEKIGVIFIDIDFFKECNDTYGHAKGDEIIREVAHACQIEESVNIRFARYGGDEFLGLTYGLEDDAVIDIARRICNRVRSANIPNINNPNGRRVTISVGIVNVAVTEKTDTIIQIANYADKAVYYSKKAGKNCIHFLDYGRTNPEGEDDPFVRIDF